MKNKTIFNTIRNVGTKAAMLALLYNCSSNPVKELPRYMADDSETATRTAHQVWGDLQLSATDFNARAVLVNGETVNDSLAGGVTFGAEKEASSALITRVMGPDGDTMKSMVSRLSDDNKKAFLSNFFTNYVKNANGYRTFKNAKGQKIDLANDVKDVDGVVKAIDMNQFTGIDYANADIETLVEKWNLWVDMTDNRPMSFIKPSTKIKMFKGQLPGLSNTKKFGSYYGRHNWKPNFGPAQKYIEDIHGHSGGRGWEIGFLPQSTYGEFEEMVTWFKSELKNAGKLFQAPGHQRLVYKVHPNLPKAKLAELYKVMQAFIVVRGIQGKTGIESARFKSVHNDSYLAGLSTGRGVIRLEGTRWGQGTNAVEFRAGTKDIYTSRLVQTTLASRLAANDFSGLADISDWNLVDGSSLNAQKMVERYGVSLAVAQKAVTNFRTSISASYAVPLWNWTDENCPFISKPKRNLIKNLTKDLIEQVAGLDTTDSALVKTNVKSMMRSWIKTTRISDELKNYMMPKRAATETGKLLSYGPATQAAARNARKVDVNKVDLVIEYSGKLPLRVDVQQTERLGDNKKAWIQTRYDHTPAEREAIIKNVAKDLLENLGGGEGPIKVDADGHGHGLDISYTIRDSKNRKWIVEWDGIGRSYTANGEIIDGSARGGSIELVTPKFTPEVNEMEAVYKAFSSNNVMPHLMTGGGHINIDLAAFKRKPKRLARFLSIFNEHRGIIALMFQHINRTHTSEPIAISANLANQLKNFTGTTLELKQLLYNERYFNTRFGRKSRYLQLDLSAYFQDVIPQEYITDDFDISNPTTPWRRQFRVDPKIRKAEFRMFNAPRDAMESALQIRLVRAMLHKALNEDGDLTGSVSNVRHEDYLKNPAKAQEDLAKMCKELGLNIEDYRPAVGEGLSETDLATRSIFFRSLEKKMNIHPHQRGWGEALAEARPKHQSLNSEGRTWTPGEADRLNTMTNEHRLRAAREGERARANIVPVRETPGTFHRSESCLDLLQSIL